MEKQCLNKKMWFMFWSMLFVISMFPVASLAGEQNATPKTGFEKRNHTDWTTYKEELEFLEEIDETSDRMTYSEIGTTEEGRPLHLVKVGSPTPPSKGEIAHDRNLLIVGSQHGNEPSGREMALQLIRDLAVTEDEHVEELLSKSTILFIPTANPDGRENNTRRNADGINLNREHLHFKTAEAQAITQVISKYDPEIIVDAHERSSASPDLEMLWPRNLNMDESLRDFNIKMIEEYVMPDAQKAGYTTGLYNKGGGDERFLHTMAGLRNSMGFLTEPTWTKEPHERVDMQMQAITSVLRFYRDHFDEIKKEIDDARERRTITGANQSEPIYFDGADHLEPTKVEENPPCGYLLHASQAEYAQRYFDAFSIENEKVEGGVFVSMAQPMMTVIPLLLDKRANHSVVDGVPVDNCSDLDLLRPPAKPEPTQFETTFTEYEKGKTPTDWSQMWRESNWVVLDEPTRLEHYVDESGGRRFLAWDKVGKVYGDVEVSGLVRSNGGPTLLQLHLHGSGNAATDHVLASENSYYIDMRDSGVVRINRLFDSNFKTLASAELPFEVKAYTWYHVLLQQEGNTLSGKVWPYGEEEPNQWQVIARDPMMDNGVVGLAHFDSGIVNEWAHIGVGTYGASAPRAPENLLPKVDKTILRNKIKEIKRRGLHEKNYTNESWTRLQQAIESANSLLEKSKVTEDQLVKALEELENAFTQLRWKKAQYQTDFSQNKVGERPYDWSTLWKESDWTIDDQPSRLVHKVTPSEGRRNLIMNAPGIVEGDVEISTLVRTTGTGQTLFHLHLFATGEVDNENSYLLDVRSSGYVRINRNLGSTFSTRKTSKLPFEVRTGAWYNAVFQHKDHTLRGKVWPFGEEEPDDWQVVVEDDNINSGYVGLGHSPGNVVNEHAFFSVGVGGERAPRAPENILDEEPEVNKEVLRNRVDEIIAENLHASDYTAESWMVFEDALNVAKEMLIDKHVTQKDVNQSLTALNAAYAALKRVEGIEQPVDDVDKSRLHMKVNVFTVLNATDYTTGTWKLFIRALRKAEQVLADEKVTQQTVDDMLSELIHARNNLKKIPLSSDDKRNHVGGDQGDRTSDKGEAPNKLDKTGGELPKTAIPYYSWLVIGIVLIVIAVIVWKISRRHQVNKTR